MALNVLGISGSLTRPSRTTALVRAVLDGIHDRTDHAGSLIELIDEAPHLFSALNRGHLRGRAADIVRQVEETDLLVVGTPVYRASYTGALKHLFDLVDHRAFVGKPVVLTATGATPLHGLVTEHELRPLFGFLNALTLPTTIYAIEADFHDYALANPKTLARVDRVATEAVEQIRLLNPLRPAKTIPLAVAAGG